MSFRHRHYVPCLRWKLGEYQAVLHLSSDAKEQITPLIEVPEIGFDFETRADKKTIDEHLAPIAKRVKKKWGTEPCFVDLVLLDPAARMTDGIHPVDFVFDALREAKCHAVPVASPERDQAYRAAVSKVAVRDGLGLCIRTSLALASESRLKAHIDSLLAESKLRPKNCDLVLDLGAPNFVPLSGFAKLIEKVIDGMPYIKRWRTFTLLGSSFPQSMAEIKSSPEIVERQEWLLYKLVTGKLDAKGLRLPTFGDYAINHPDVFQIDMRLVKPSASIRYTVDDAWFVVKGPNVRQNGYGQYRGHCTTVLKSGFFCGTAFSAGDKYIKGCAKGTETTGNLTTWRWVGTNHHIEKVVRDVASLHDLAGSP